MCARLGSRGLGSRVRGRERSESWSCQLSPDPPGSLRALRPKLPSLDLGGEEMRSARSCGSTRSVAANGGIGGGAGWLLSAGPKLPPPAHPPVPSRLRRLRQGLGEGGGDREGGPRVAKCPVRGWQVPGLQRAAKRARPRRNQNWVPTEPELGGWRPEGFFSPSEVTGRGSRGSRESTCRAAL